MSGADKKQKGANDFEFFCRHPADWFEGANMGHLISIAFESEVDEEDQRAIAKHIYRAMEFDDVLFAGRCVKFFTGGDDERNSLAFLARVERFARKLHAEVPIADIIFHGMREGETGYAHPPTAAADMNFGSGVPRPIDKSAPPWEAGEAFDAELKKIHLAWTTDKTLLRDRKGIDKALAKQKEGPIQVREAERPEVAEPDLSLFSLAPPYGRDEPPSAGDRPCAHSGELSVARVFDGKSFAATELAVVDGKSRVAFELRMPIHRVSVSPCGEYALFSSSPFISRVDLATGDITPLPFPNAHEIAQSHNAHEFYQRFVALANGCWAVLTTVALYVFDEDNTLLVRKKIKGTSVAAFADGYGVAVWKGPALTAFRFVHGKLKQLTKFAYAPGPLVEIGDALYFGTKVGDLVLEGAHADIAAERARTPRKRKSKAIDCSFLTWLPAPGVEAPAAPPVELPSNIDAYQAAASPSGEWVAFQTKDLLPGRRLRLCVFHRPTATISTALPECTDFFMTDDARLVALGFGQVMWRTKPESDTAAEWPGLRHSLSLRKGRASYLHEHDLLFFFPQDSGQPTLFACGEQIYPLLAFPGLRGAFERDGKAYLQWGEFTIEVEGLKQVAAS
ncbi:MAG: hypothetical protein AB8H86_26085 [Polyangiales bacterium]